MIVYGDPSFERPLTSAITELSHRFAALSSRCAGASRERSDGPSLLDASRELLIHCGQVEQAIEDAPIDAKQAKPLADLCEWVRAATDRAAAAFLQLHVFASLTQTLAITGEPVNLPIHDVRIKVPEGFAFYALFPEQYHSAALRWLAAHSQVRERRAIVVGVRSIGTTLSAVVRQTLVTNGWQATRLTVRPDGNPFDRRVEIPPDCLAGAAHAIIVDEGPGLSGSSMAAVGAALVSAGVPRERISFFPGHSNGPGQAGSAATRDWWATTPQYVTPLVELRWAGRLLPEVLARRASALLGGEPIECTEDLSAGMWRKAASADESQWPVAFTGFERTKYRCVTRGGRSVLWKFAGTAMIDAGAQSSNRKITSGTAQSIDRLRALARLGWTPAPLGEAFGFVATPWAAGAVLTRSDADPALLAHVGQYVRAAALPPVSQLEQEQSFSRLSEMLYWNAREALGEVAAERARELAMRAKSAIPNGPDECYGDGRLAPHEWVRTASGQLQKLDCAGHQSDHTAIGSQPLAWDIAGAMVEWQATGDAAKTLLAAVQEGRPKHYADILLRFYRAAYAAFWLGMCAMGEGTAKSDPAELRRLQDATNLYRDALKRELLAEF